MLTLTSTPTLDMRAADLQERLEGLGLAPTLDECRDMLIADFIEQIRHSSS